MRKVPRIVSKRTVAGGSWLELQQIEYVDYRDRRRTWESVERKQAAGAVVIIPVLLPSNELILLRQYRPPAAGHVIEFPAGLIDEDESPESAALRELREETGYTGQIMHKTPACFTSPGLSNETIEYVIITIDEKSATNGNPESSPEGSEDIEVLRVPLPELSEYLEQQMAEGVKLDAKLAAVSLTFSSTFLELSKIARSYPGPGNN